MTQPSVTTTLLEDVQTIRRWSQGVPIAAQPEIDTINVLLGDGVNVLTTGVKAALRVDFNAFIAAGFVHEFDGTSGSISVGIEKATYEVGFAPTFTSIVASAPLVVSSARYGENVTLTGWTRSLSRGEVLRFSITSVSAFKRILVALRVRRLEP